MEIDALINRDTRIDLTLPLANPTFLPDRYTPLIKMNRKMGLVRERNIVALVSSVDHMYC